MTFNDLMSRYYYLLQVAAPVPVVISRALELFIESLILKTSQTTKERNAKTMTTQHIKQVEKLPCIYVVSEITFFGKMNCIMSRIALFR